LARSAPLTSALGLLPAVAPLAVGHPPITHRVPPLAGCGRIAVATPADHAVSRFPFFVLPTPYTEGTQGSGLTPQNCRVIIGVDLLAHALMRGL